ncbi:MAG TPA: hypothetical protein V6C63_00480 [Allocoleopsis sp.]
MTSDSSKNITKYESYKYAFERLQEALEKEFFLEAVMIAESIVADRLLSYLTLKLQEAESDKTLNPRAALKHLIDQWAKLDGIVIYKERQNLISDIDQWRGDRNECAHGLVKSNPGDPTKPVEEFRNKARDCALQGKQLARDLCSWTQSQKSKIRKSA